MKLVSFLPVSKLSRLRVPEAMFSLPPGPKVLSESKLGSMELYIIEWAQDGLFQDNSESWINMLEKEMNSIELIQISCHLILMGRILAHQ